jgi:hypothetical protein
MKTVLAITDVTRMYEGRVCVAGYDKNGKCIRPVLPHPGLHERSLYSRGRPIVFPFAIVALDLLEPLPHAPHTEDCDFEPTSIRLIDQLDDKHKRAELTRTLSPTVKDIFEVPILTKPGHYVLDGQGPRSLGTIRPRVVIRADFKCPPEGKRDYRLTFVDGSETFFRLMVTDLTWRYYNDHQQKAGQTPEQISQDLTSRLRRSGVYLRVGLARGWDKFPERCYLQVTGIYTFPDYLDGQTFADLAPAAPALARFPSI